MAVHHAANRRAFEPTDRRWSGADPLEGCREVFGRSTRLWGGKAARHRVEPGYWETLSGLAHLDYNVIGVHGASKALVERAVATIEAEAVPALVLLAGPALDNAHVLAVSGWAPVAPIPFMGVALGHGRFGELDAGVLRLGPDHLDELRQVVMETFRVPESSGTVLVPDEAVRPIGEARHPDSAAHYDAWGLLRDDALVSAVLTSTVEGSVCIWAMATPPRRQHHGYGRRLLRGVLAAVSERGADRALLLSTAAGERLYRTCGFGVLESWQVWSKRGSTRFA